MQKINWINGQAGGTPLSAENLNLMQDYAEEAMVEYTEAEDYAEGKIVQLKDGQDNAYPIVMNHIISATINSNFTKTKADYEQITLQNTSSVIIGKKLTINNGGIVIGAGVKTVLVSARVNYDSMTTSGVKWLGIFKGNSAFSTALVPLSSRSSVSSNPTLLSVNAGDVITIRLYGAAGDVIRSGLNYTCLTVEVVEET